MIGSGKKEGWPECFQDLGGWCPLPQDELHTPKFNLQDEFNVSIDDGHINDWDLLSAPVDLQCPWGDNTHFGITPCQPLIEELDVNSVVQDRILRGVISNKTPNLLGSGGKFIYSSDGSKSPLKPKGNVLLSQGIVKSASDDSTLLSMAETIEHKSIKPVAIANDCYLLPVAVPELASAKLNSSSTSFITRPQQPPTPTPSTLTKKVYGSKEDTICGVIPSQNNLENIRIKEEEQGVEDGFKVPMVCKEVIDLETLPVYRPLKPKLKLNIAAANSTPKFVSALSTPEVLKPLVEGGDSKEFDLLSYVCNNAEYPEFGHQENIEEEEEHVGDHAIRDHDYVDPWPASDVVIKSEPGSPVSTSCSYTQKGSNKGRQKRQRDDSSDYIASDDSDELLSDDDSQPEWSPTPAKKRAKRKISTNSTKSSGKTGTSGKRVGAGRRNSGSRNNKEKLNVGGGQDKYRALRERNNEASRRSRMNRKQRDEDMLQQANELHKKNIYLKARAEKMENLVKYMRGEIMKAFTKPKT